MNRRSFFQGVAALFALPKIDNPKVEPKPLPKVRIDASQDVRMKIDGKVEWLRVDTIIEDRGKYEAVRYRVTEIEKGGK